MELRPPLHLGVVAIEKGAFGSPSTKVANYYTTKKTAKANIRKKDERKKKSSWREIASDAYRLLQWKEEERKGKKK